MKRALTVIAALAAVIATVQSSDVRAAQPARYRLVENWAHFPPGMTTWSAVTGVDVDAQDNLYVFQRSDTAPIIAFDRRGAFLRAWGQGLFTLPHFLRVDHDGHVWVTDRGGNQVFEFTSAGAPLLTLGTKGVGGDNASTTLFNGAADLVVAKNGDVFIADGEGANTRVVKYAKDGTFIKWWGGKGAGPGQFDTPHSIAMDSKGRLYVADRANDRIQIFDQDGTFIDQWKNFGTPRGLFITRDDTLYVVDGTANNCLLMAKTTDGKVYDRIDGLNNATAVTVDSTGAIYVGEVIGANVKKFVKE